MLAVQPSSLQQRIGLVFGSKNEVERIERYHNDPHNDPHPQPVAMHNPLFNERSLFRVPA